MSEMIGNGLQFAVVAGLAVYSMIFFLRNRNQQYFILASFYGSFALGSGYWLIYFLKFSYTPQFFYVSDLSWIASYLFLVLLCVLTASPQEKGYRPVAAWVVAAILSVLTIRMLRQGDVLITLIWNGLMTLLGFLSTRGFLYARKQTGIAREKQVFYGTVFAVVVIEFGLWMASLYSSDGTWSGPYFWFDIALTASLIALLFAVKKVTRP